MNHHGAFLEGDSIAFWRKKELSWNAHGLLVFLHWTWVYHSCFSVLTFYYQDSTQRFVKKCNTSFQWSLLESVFVFHSRISGALERVSRSVSGNTVSWRLEDRVFAKVIWNTKHRGQGRELIACWTQYRQVSVLEERLALQTAKTHTPFLAPRKIVIW